MTNLDIETFWAVVHHGTMTAAAESLYITQPTLSMRIRALEERVGTPLFVRGKGQRHITLTEAGQKFLTLAQRWQQLLAETDSLAELGQREYLRIAATYTTNQYILPPVYKRFLAQGLPVSLWIHTLPLSVNTCSAHTTWFIMSLIAAPGKFIWHLKLKSFCNNILLGHFNKWCFYLNLLSASKIYRLIHRIVKCITAVRICVTCRIITMCSIVDY